MRALKMIGNLAKASVLSVYLVVVLSACSTEQVEHTIYNAARGKLCIETDKGDEGELGVEPCGGSYARYKAARKREIEQKQPQIRPASPPETVSFKEIYGNTVIDSHQAVAISSEGTKGCWVHHTTQSKGRSNKVTLCTFEVTAHLTIYFPNALSEFEPTTCTQSGATKSLNNRTALIALNEGTCKNGNTSPALVLNCELTQEKLGCDDRTYGKYMEFTRRPDG